MPKKGSKVRVSGGIPPDTPRTPWIRTSERLTFNRCPQQWEYAYLKRLEPYHKSPALRFGTLVHLALEKYYRKGFKRGPHPRKTFELVYAKDIEASGPIGRFKADDAEKVDYLELGILMLDEYISHYGMDERWEVIATEQAFHQPVYDDSGKLLFTYVGVIDLIVRDLVTDFTGFVDHKTTRDDPTKKTEALILDEQTSAYWTHGQDALRKKGVLKRELDGVIFNFLRKGKPDTRPKDAQGRALNKPVTAAEKRRGYGAVSERQPTPLFHRELVYRDDHDAEKTRKRIRDQAQQMRYMRTGKLPIYKVPGTLHDPYCKWCPFNAMCEAEEIGADWEAIQRTEMTTWSPYEQHAIYEGETSS